VSDDDLKGFIREALQGVEERTAKALQRLEDRTAALILAEVSNLRVETRQGFDHIDKLLVSINDRLKVQAGLIQGGARAMARFSEFAETSEQRWVALVARVEELERKVERPKNGN
jgi:hypothetical protein